MKKMDEHQYIRENYLKKPIKTIARELGRSGTFVRCYLTRNNLVRPKKIIEKFRRESQFKVGQKAHNKGKKQEEFMTPEAIEKTKKTRFKKGHQPKNTKYKGHISIRRDSQGKYLYKYIQIKKGRYVLLHRLVWEKANGTIPKNYNVQFKDGDTLNCDLDNLYLIHRKDQIRINQLYGGASMPYELIDTAILVNKLKLKINEKQNNRS